MLLPVVLMMGKALADIIEDDEEDLVRRILDILGTPVIALLIAVIVAIFTFGRGAGMDRDDITKSLETSLPPIAGILLIVCAGGGFKQVLVDTGIGTKLADWATDADVSVLLLAWVLAVLIRLATGSATVATITASALMVGLVDGLSRARRRWWCSRSAPARSSSPTSTTPASGWSRSTSGCPSARPSSRGR